MLRAFGSGFKSIVSNQDTPSTTPGTSITPGTGGKGSWATCLSALSDECFLLAASAANGSTSAATRNTLMDIGYDPAGGTAFNVLIPDICCGNAANVIGKPFLFPIRVPAGASIGVRAHSQAATAFRAWLTSYGKPTRPELVRSGRYAEAIGVGTAPVGTLITPGTSGAEGSWTSLGTTAKRLWWWQIGAQLNDASTNSQVVLIDLAVGDASNKRIIIQNQVLYLLGTAENEVAFMSPTAYCDVPAGSTLYGRMSSSIATLDSNYNMVATGIGG